MSRRGVIRVSVASTPLSPPFAMFLHMSSHLPTLPALAYSDNSIAD